MFRWLSLSNSMVCQRCVPCEDHRSLSFEFHSTHAWCLYPNGSLNKHIPVQMSCYSITWTNLLALLAEHIPAFRDPLWSLRLCSRCVFGTTYVHSVFLRWHLDDLPSHSVCETDLDKLRQPLAKHILASGDSLWCLHLCSCCVFATLKDPDKFC